MRLYMLRHKFRDHFYFKPHATQTAVMKEGTGTLFKTKWGAERALENTKLCDLQIVIADIEIKALPGGD